MSFRKDERQYYQDKSMKKDIDIKIIKTISKKIENAKNNLNNLEEYPNL